MSDSINTKLTKKIFEAVDSRFPYHYFGMGDYDSNYFWVVTDRSETDDGVRYDVRFARPNEKYKLIASLRFPKKTSDKHIVNRLSSIIQDWVSKTRIKAIRTCICESEDVHEQIEGLKKERDNWSDMYEAERKKVEELEKERDYYKDRAVKYDDIFSELNNAMEAAGYKLRRIPARDGKIYQRKKLTREDLF